MICFRDETFCVSPGCVNACGRKLTPGVVAAAAAWWGSDDAPVAVGWFCGGDPGKAGRGDAVAEVMRQRRENPGGAGCCNRYADMQGCDCLTATATEAR